MIVFRYLSREVMITLGAVTAVLLVIIMSSRFIKYLAQAASGMLEPKMLVLIITYRIPGFLQLILPLSLFLAVLLVYGRLYVNNEMTVLSATGMSQSRLLAYTLAPALLIALVVAWLTTGLAPGGVAAVERILDEQDSLTEFDTLVPGRFQALLNGDRVTYAETIDDDKQELGGVFIWAKATGSKGKQGNSMLFRAEKGHPEVNEQGDRYLVLTNGYRYDGVPGQANYRVSHFARYGLLLPRPELGTEDVTERDAVPTSKLIGSNNSKDKAELQWRLSLPLLALVVALMAVPLARVNPRQGRYVKLLPAILLYMIYLSLLVALRGAIHGGHYPAVIGVWPVHLLFIVIAAWLWGWRPLGRRSGWRAA